MLGKTREFQKLAYYIQSLRKQQRKFTELQEENSKWLWLRFKRIRNGSQSSLGNEGIQRLTLKDFHNYRQPCIFCSCYYVLQPFINYFSVYYILSMSADKGKQKKITMADFKNVQLIGQGAFGTVYKGIYDKNNKAFAIKKISKKKIISQNMSNQVKKEIEIMNDLNHPNIVRLYEVFEDDEYLYLVLELAEKGQLYTKLMQKGRFDETSTKAIVVDLISALSYLHGRNPPIIHRDIKPENILLDKNERVKLADFGWSNFSNKQRTTYCGTYDYLAPEMIDKSGHDEKLDIWCLGVLVYEMLHGKPPFAPLPGEDETKRLQQNIVNVRVNFPSDFPVLAREFVMMMLKRNPKERATLQQLKNHQWLVMKPISKLPAAHIEQYDTIPEPPTSSSSPNGDQQFRRIIQQLNRKNQELERQVGTLKISEQMRLQKEQQQKDMNGGEDRKYKLLEEMNEKYKREIAKLQGDLEEKAREVGRGKVESRAVEEARKNAERYKQERNQLQESYKSLQQLHEDMERKYIDLNQRYENEKLDYQMKLKQVRHQSVNGHTQIDSPEGLSKLQDAISQLCKKFNESKRILSDVAKRQSAMTEAEKQLQRLRFEQNSIRDQIRMQLKQQYEQQMDDLMVKAREELMAEREKWFAERQQLANFERESTMDTENSALNSTRDLEVQNQLKMAKELNTFYEKRVRDQEYKINDLEDKLRKKK